MGRRNLSRLLALLVVLVVVAPAAATSAVPFRVVAHGITERPTPKPFAIVGTSPVTAHRIVVRVTSELAKPILGTDFRRSIVLGVFGPFGCTDGRVRIASVTQSGSVLTVHVSIKPLPPGVTACMAIYETVRVLVVRRSALHGTPTKALVAVARR